MIEFLKTLPIIAGIISKWQDWRHDRAMKQAGRDAARSEMYEGSLNDIKKANQVRDRLVRDDEYYERVRKRYTRK